MTRRWLTPLVPLYAAAVALRNRRFDQGSAPVGRLHGAVISIGNLSTGGSGKTPLTIALAEALTARGILVDILSRGYGRQSSEAARVDPAGAAADFGDEPLLIARETGLPVYVAPQRYQAGLLAEADAGRDDRPPLVHLLDDGFQHRQLHRDIDIVLLDHSDWRDRLLPAGNLREPLRSLNRATILAIPADEPNLESELRAWGWQGPIWRFDRIMEIPPVPGPVLAFCGIARPDQFFAGLQAAGVTVADRRTFPDHHRYTAADLIGLLSATRAANAGVLFTTEKDQIRLNPHVISLSPSTPILSARLRTEIQNRNAAIDWLIARLRPQPPL
jgi:tetraacyldisaccharide 4'-kinase